MLGTTTVMSSANVGVMAATNIAGSLMSNMPVSSKVETSVGGTLLAAAMIPGPQAPFLAIAGGIVEFLGIMGVGSGCGQSCVLSSQYANKAEDILKQNLSAYMSMATPRDCTAKAVALANFDAIWSDLVQQCSNPVLGDAGKHCISDRQAGACHWGGDCWNWFVGYRDPIANDSCVTQSVVSSLTNNPLMADANQLIASTGLDWTTILALGLVAIGISKLG